MNSQAGGGKQGEKQKGVVGHCFGSEVSVWLAEKITRKKVGEQRKCRTNAADERKTKRKKERWSGDRRGKMKRERKDGMLE